MQVNSFNIEIGENSFYFHETTPQKSDSAMTTLMKIEHVLQNLNHLSYDTGHPDGFTNLSKKELCEVLGQKAKEIRNNFMQEQSKKSGLSRFIYNDEKVVNDVFKRIRKLTAAPVLPIHKDSVLQILEKTRGDDVFNFSRVNVQGNEIGKEAILAKIQKMGYKGNNYGDAIKYLKELRLELKEFMRESKIETVEVVESLLEKLKNMSNEELINLYSDSSFSMTDKSAKMRAFLRLNFKLKTDPLKTDILSKQRQVAALGSSLYGNSELLKILLELGVPPDSRINLFPNLGDMTALELAQYFDKFTDNTDCINMLKEALGYKNKVND